MIVIPQRNLNSYVIKANLEGRSYNLRFDWNEEAQLWTMAIGRTSLGEYLITSLPLLPARPLLYPFPKNELPPGEFIVDSEADPTRDSFVEGRSTLYYLSSQEIEEAAPPPVEVFRITSNIPGGQEDEAPYA